MEQQLTQKAIEQQPPQSSTRDSKGCGRDHWQHVSNSSSRGRCQDVQQLMFQKGLPENSHSKPPSLPRPVFVASCCSCCSYMDPYREGRKEAKRQASLLKQRLGRNIELNEFELVSPRGGALR